MLVPNSTKGLCQKLPTICTKGRELFKKAGVQFLKGRLLFKNAYLAFSNYSKLHIP